MIRNLKVLGLALVAVFAMSAVTASMASAQGKLTTDGADVKLTGINTGATLENSLTAFGGNTTCPNVVYTGTEVGSLTNRVPNGATQTTITPHYGLCTTLGIPFSTVDMTGCDYVFDLGGTVGVNQYSITATVKNCPAGKGPVVKVYSSAAKHTANEPFCEVEVTPEEDPKTQNLVARDTTNGHIDVTGTVADLEAHKRSPTGSILCPSENTKNGILHLDITVSGDNSGGNPTGVSLSD